MTDKGDIIYRTLVRHINAHGYAPTIRELCKLVGVKSPATMQARLQELETSGMIERVGPRAIKIK